MPKALADTGSGPWVLRTLNILAGCDRRLVVVGARADDVAALLPSDVGVLVNPEYRSGMGSSLRAGLGAAAADPAVDAALIMLVDLPDVPSAAVHRVLAGAGGSQRDVRAVLLRAGYHGTPGHPVLIGRDHFSSAAAATTADTGARAYLAAADAALLECGDLATGTDVDTPPER